MLKISNCTDVSPQCPDGQQEAYKLGWHHGQIDLIDRHDGSPCQVISLQQEIDRLGDLATEHGQCIADIVTKNNRLKRALKKADEGLNFLSLYETS